MKIGDLVKLKCDDGPYGLIMRIDGQYFGANTAYKISRAERGKCLRPAMVDMIGKTADGIRDRVLVLWSDTRSDLGWEYCESTELEVISD